MRLIEVFLGSKALLKAIGLGINCFLTGIITLEGLCLTREVSCFLELDGRAVLDCFTAFKTVLTTIISLLVLLSAVREVSLFCVRPAKLWLVTELAGEGLRWVKLKIGGTRRGASRAGDLNFPTIFL
jgi:hypothetical protein